MRERGGRRAAIVQAAFRQVAEVGFEGLRLRQIAEDVGIDHSTLHHHFPGKREIVASVAEYTIGQFAAVLPEAFDPAESLRGYLAHLRELLEHSPALFVVTAELDLRARRDPIVRAVMQAHEANWRRSLRDMLAKRDDWAPGVDAGDITELIIAVVKGVQLAPEAADAAFGQLDALLSGMA
ncbi:TetR/AcrR family transcriptional regulator [Saccharothrix sp. S26]|uniref:TetR/AcrR family transcriptional regulator n=1 Tax=Saccharothrix sp. S26 TaxID=2907215 RepID=UPI001F3A1516|nr:TetR/AcrR family transcriptional regulator [Saccharothrix sp. S26]MCE6995345.1 TetR/AcrR family transcriptional regulator [Saccharothrix sp. S26]